MTTLISLLKCRNCKKCPIEEACPVKAAKRGEASMTIDSTECTNCGRCAAVCPENAIRFATRFQAKPQATEPNNE